MCYTNSVTCIYYSLISIEGEKLTFPRHISVSLHWMINNSSIPLVCKTVCLFQNSQYGSCFSTIQSHPLCKIRYTRLEPSICRLAPRISPAQTLHWASSFALNMLDLDSWTHIPHTPHSILLLALLLGLSGEHAQEYNSISCMKGKYWLRTPKFKFLDQVLRTKVYLP